MKTRINIISSLLLLLLCISMFSACQGENAIAEQTGADNQIDPGETAAEQKTYSDPQDITTMLQELERIRMEQWLAQPGWWHAQKVFKDQSGNLHGTGGEEWWFQFSDAQTCPQTLQTIFQEDGQVRKPICSSAKAICLRKHKMPNLPLKNRRSNWSSCRTNPALLY
jgi:hypothetical protein